jgi:hypothetical protein
MRRTFNFEELENIGGAAAVQSLVEEGILQEYSGGKFGLISELEGFIEEILGGSRS